MSVLTKAEAIIHGARARDYGSPAINHGRTAALWSVYLDQKITPEQVCMLNILQKVSRSLCEITEDTLVDIAGYAGNIEMIRGVEE